MKLPNVGDGPAVDGAKPGWGPLRVWPGGLCLSRALGDFDVGPAVIPLPHVFQVGPVGPRIHQDPGGWLCQAMKAGRLLL